MTVDNTMDEQQTLKQGLSNRHIQLIALGGAIGTGLFLGISHTIQLAGPSVLLGYALAGVIAFGIWEKWWSMNLSAVLLVILPTNTGGVWLALCLAGIIGCYTSWLAWQNSVRSGHLFSFGGLQFQRG